MEEAPEAEPTDAVACLGADVASDLPFFFSLYHVTLWSCETSAVGR